MAHQYVARRPARGPAIPHPGQGLQLDPRVIDMVRISTHPTGYAEGSEIVGDYHNGLLSVILPFGIFGVLTFFWFVAAAGRVFYWNYRYGEAALKRINTFLLAFYLAKLIFFLVIFGSLYVDLPMFAGIVGLSISLNGGVAKRPAQAPEPTPVINRFRLPPGLRKPLEV